MGTQRKKKKKRKKKIDLGTQNKKIYMWERRRSIRRMMI